MPKEVPDLVDYRLSDLLLYFFVGLTNGLYGPLEDEYPVGLAAGVEDAAFRQRNAVVETEQVQRMVESDRIKLLVRRIVLDDAGHVAFAEDFGKLGRQASQGLFHQLVKPASLDNIASRGRVPGPL